MFQIFLLLFVATSALPSRPQKELKCGYESCTNPKEGHLNIHIVPHTHDDVGWLKTVDQYYYGNRNDIQKAGVQYILDSVIKELWENPERRFIYVETAFFWKWWMLQSGEVQRMVHELVASGRLKFVGGAWSMNDEATTYYQTTIDQFTFGLGKLNETFGECGRPKVGWQIDPFGHSREFASLLAGMGYDGLFLGRIDYQDKQARLADQRMEVLWRGDDMLGPSSDIFTSVLYNTYSPPPGFCFDVLCQDEPIVDDPESPDYNVERRIEQFFERARGMAKSYVTNNILVTMGDDFQYQEAGMWYKNLDKLILYGNLKSAKDGTKFNLFYSTPDCYLKAVKDANPTLPTKRDDFFPYASDPHAYWTGYFTSRPAIKYLEAQTNIYLQMVKQLQVFSRSPSDYQPNVDKLKGVMGVMQHHDAVTGTEKQHVARDYARMVAMATHKAHDVITAALNEAMNVKAAGLPPLEFDRCQFNESRCDATEGATGNLIVTAYNPLAWPVSTPVVVPVAGGDYECTDAQGQNCKVQVTEIPKSIINIPTRVSSAVREITFVASLSALGYKTFYLTKKTKKTKRGARSTHGAVDLNEYWNNLKRNTNYNAYTGQDEVLIPDAPVSFEFKRDTRPDKRAKDLLKTNGAIDKNVEEFEKLLERDEPKIRRHDDNPFSNMDGDEMRMLSDEPMLVTRYDGLADQQAESNQRIIKSVTINNREYNLKSSGAYYPAVIGNNMVFENRSSGAYIFRPDTVQPVNLEIIDEQDIDGDIFKEKITTTNNNAVIRSRTYKDKIDYVEIDWLVGPIPIEDDVGKEYIIKYDVNAITNGEFYTDSNGRQVLLRKLNQRPDWNLTLEEPVAGNYYPVVDVAGFKSNDGDVFMYVLPDRAVGAASLQDGSIEVMVHRRLLHDDAFGVGEALNETENGIGLVARGSHRVYLTAKDITFKEIIEMRLKPQIFVSNADGISLDKWKQLVNEYSWLKSPMPAGVHLLTVEARGKDMLVRFENYLETATEVDLKDVFKGLEIKNVKETILAANAWSHDKWVWNTIDNVNNDNTVNEKDGDDFKLKLAGKQIRTFVVGYEKKNV